MDRFCVQVLRTLKARGRSLLRKMLPELGLKSRDLGFIQEEGHLRETSTFMWYVIYFLKKSSWIVCVCVCVF